MNSANTILLSFLNELKQSQALSGCNSKVNTVLVKSWLGSVSQSFSKTESNNLFSELFILAGFFACSVEPLLALIEAADLKKNKQNYQELFEHEMLPLADFAPFIETCSIKELRRVADFCTSILRSIADSKKNAHITSEVLEFSVSTVAKIDQLAVYESQLSDSKFARHGIEHSIYRAYDALDGVFAIDYSLDAGMYTDPLNTERLYEGAGLGVQTSYLTLALALRSLNLKSGARLIDLGSGYGRLGFVVGLLRPDIEFIGYEYVSHRVLAANKSAQHIGINKHVKFITQDLSDKHFQIPTADAYYLYDPFTESTYRHVFHQLRFIASQQSIAIVTKGHAGPWVANALMEKSGDGSCNDNLSALLSNQMPQQWHEQWTVDRSLDHGSLGVFRSIPVPYKYEH